jgi:flavin reductase ActVB
VIVTARDATLSDWGITATSLTVVSDEPPLVAVSLYSEAGSTSALIQSEGFAVSVLRPEHEDLAERFASGRPDKFILGGFEALPSGLRAVSGALAVIECRTAEAHPAGDHTILMGEVQTTSAASGAALVYFRRGYAAVEPPAP